ncbi:enduracididine biosynthesis enzyme MppR [Streptomyces albidoflavus]|jgi:enduracididine biosynthesis enzyme MppR|uniref:Acetoacetate decarboxylase n=2 Tax=Streptomyces TaxID=1883 RepID=A0A8G2E2Y1_9ACTN|nr:MULTISPECIES: enduracididine biosynthesis enzyme MppR [Streptomyces]MYX85450.1 enduracididine biosynthesis enzyme MppR [Streptomyces sp. SID4915]QLA57308.1 enduracididine biosynthesis enzyme MppR [Streptomyces violascens]AWL33917.1 enduracididine biosynthesis enzyme MppR [Streptomyces sp. SM17]KDR62039.1 acetoacetate decarboxylase [Streptomyces wadayamensis]KUL58863.1 enduracididine biosynthesis enzyme MppR [Streptomyces albidoflavus]
MLTEGTARAGAGGDRGTAGPRGYSLPLSPSGEASMLTPPPWHFTGEVVMVDYRVDPGAAAAFLPPGLSPGPDIGAAAAVFADWQWCSDSGEELTDPARNRFSEFLILLACEFEGRAMARCPFAWVDQPVPMMRGWVQGMPKQFGDVHMSRAATLGRSAPRLGKGGLFAGSLSVYGRRAVEATVSLEEVSDTPPALHDVPLAHTLTFPDWAATGAMPSVLVASEVSGVEFSPVWSGAARLGFHEVLGEDFASLAPVDVGRGHVFSYAETLRGGAVLTTDHH